MRALEYISVFFAGLLVGVVIAIVGRAVVYGPQIHRAELACEPNGGVTFIKPRNEIVVDVQCVNGARFELSDGDKPR